MATTAISEQQKLDWMAGGTCMNATQTGVACTCASTIHMTGLASTANLAVGMGAAGTNCPAGNTISKIVSATAVDLAIASTGAFSSATFTGDVFNIALVKPTPSATYDQTFLNYGSGSGSPTQSNMGTDEASGAGYSAGGFALTNVNPALSSATAVGTFSVNPSWTSASFSCVAGVIYNTSQRLGAASGQLNNHAVSIHDFGGTQTVSAGTLTLILPTANSSTGLLRIA